MVFYRKYRPQTIEELDSKEVRERITAVFSQLEPPHAFLFTGPKGLGKTSTARIVAKILNCEGRGQRGKSKGEEWKNIEPCNHCEQCVWITNGTNLDVLEIDGASNRGIDEIRDLREKVRLSPLAAKKKVYIIDEVHMLTTEAFNALLKIIEEPPLHTVFIFCTTEPHKVPETIVSRCVHIGFKTAAKDELIRSFERIVQSEHMTIDADTLPLLADLSEGSFRDGAKLLEELVVFARQRGKDTRITQDLLEGVHKLTTTNQAVEDLIGMVIKNDTKNALLLVAHMTKQGMDMKHVLEVLIAALHSQLLMSVGVAQDNQSRTTNHGLSVVEIKQLIELFTQAFGEMKYAVLPQLPLELAIIDWGIRKTNMITDEKEQVNQNRETKTHDNGQRVPQSAHGDTDLLSALIERVKKENQSVAALLRGSKIHSQNEEQVVLETKFPFHQEKLSEKKTLELLAHITSEILGKNVTVLVRKIKS